ncbi:hypothetical protein [Stenomitos frigidus]|uniref:Uncharacterized protein n=1 Tax=Stenomitos frigidus ULC18 TaxID=2107698 RepID=A0A2T1E5A4_9CYAN|nr:hypothetical protein [Stenomitos frigidus]PSB27900.1 hypothetical protein C7B82_16135 [Stenomitos frigidus ULC18]
MTSQKDQIQALITDIDGVLQKTTPRLPWVVSGEVTQQRQVLERVRNYLVTFQRRQIVGESYGQAGDRPDLLAHDIYSSQSPYQSPPLEAQAERSQAYGRDELSAQQMLQAIVQDMGYLRANVMQPLQSDLELLRQQRESLVQEIHQLESQRQGYAGQLPGNQQQMIAEFLQALMSRLQETLPQQVAQTLRGSNQQSLPYSADLARSGSAPLQAASNSIAQGLGNIQVPQSQSDELLIKLDSTLSVVFESLQRNVQAYEESLSQGLDKMHSMGQQGEMMFTALISHLANQLGQEASSYLQPPATKGLESARLANPASGAMTPGFSPSSPQPLSVVNAPLFEQPSAGATSQPFTLPFPGTEISSNFTDAVPVSALDTPAPSVDTAIDSWLRSASGVDATPTVDYELAELNLEGFDLNQLAAQDVNALLELDANLLSTNLAPQPILAPTTALPSTNESSSGSVSVEDTADIDAALKLLEQLSSELKEQPASVADADAQIDRMLSTPSPLTEDTTATGIPDDARDELDEFYESLFGNDAIAAQASLETPAAMVDVNQPPANAAVEPAPTIASPTTQTTTAQPIDVLPADTQAPKSTLVPPEIVAAPAVSAVVDPTLGWDLLAKPLSTQAAADIPVALLDDELLSGWDFEDAEIGLAETEPVTDGNELLGVEEASTSSDRDPLVDMPAAPTDTNVVSSASPVTASAETLLPDPAPAVAQPISTDEITTLADLFDETTPAEGLEASIANPIVLPENLSQPSPPPPASATELTLPITANQALADQADDRRLGDRYTPASPEEDLLPLEEPVDEADSELWLDEGTLTRLSEDLFNLEETIVEPSILPYGVESEVNPSGLYSDAAPSEVVAPGEAALTGIAFSSDDPTSLEDWSASLNDFADALSTNDSTQAATASELNVIAAEPPGAFILEGMDDLFADIPAAPPVTAVPPPVVSTQADASAAFTLEGMDDLFADAPTGTTPLPPTSFPETDQPLFTLQGIDDLFDGVPMAGSTPLPSAPGYPSDQSLPFTLEGVDELFADAPPVNVAPMGDALPTADALPPVPETATTDLPVQFAFDSDSTLETTDDIFVPAPTASVPPPDDVSNRAIETSSDLLLNQSSEVVAPFTFEQIGDLFMEVPSGEVPLHEPVAHEQAATGFTTAEQPVEVVPEPALAPFTLERVGDVFIEKTFEEAGSDLLTTPNPQLPSSPPTTEPSTLEQAFASLMGSFDDPMPATDGVDTPDPEKKK